MISLSLFESTTEYELSQTDPVLGCTYVPAPVDSTLPEVAESILVILEGTPVDIEAWKSSIEGVLDRARINTEDNIGSKIYLHAQLETTVPEKRSRVRRGDVYYVDGPPAPRLDAEVAKVQVVIVRDNYWEGTTETAVSISNGHGSGTGGITVYNHNDSAQDNWVGIAANVIDGSLPAPCRIEIQNTYNDPDDIWRVWIGHNYRSSPASLNPILEGESATGGSNTAEATASAGYYKSVTWTAEEEIDALTWSLSSTLLGYCQSNLFRLITRFWTTSPADCWLRFMIKADNNALSDTGWFRISSLPNLLQDIATIRIPPVTPPISGTLAPLNLTLSFKKTGTSSKTAYIDFIQLTPLDGYRVLKSPSYQLPYQSTLIDDGMSEEVWSSSGSGRIPNFYGLGEPIRLYPDVAQRLYFLFDLFAIGYADNNITATVKVFYRPRWRNL